MKGVVGITGGIGCGKSEVMKIVNILGSPTINMDSVAHEVLVDKTDLIVHTFGTNILNSDKTIDCKELGKLVFSNSQLLKKLNSIVHPDTVCKLKVSIENFKDNEECRGVLFVEIPLLFEFHLEALFNEIICVAADDDIRLSRITYRDNISIESAQERIDSQMPLSSKMHLSSIVIYNNGSYQDLIDNVEKMYSRLLAKYINYKGGN